jgi:hypothetical protein
MKRLKAILFAAAAAAVGLYVGDLIVVRVRMAVNGDTEPYAQLQMNVLYAVPEKGSKIGYMPGQPETDECVRSLFPHFGDSPCWYASRQKTKRVDL